MLAHGQINRATGVTQMNIQSSRSHALLCVAVKGENKVTGVITLGMSITCNIYFYTNELQMYAKLM